MKGKHGETEKKNRTENSICAGKSTDPVSGEVHAREEHIGAEDDGTEIGHEVGLGQAAGHDPGGDPGDALGCHDRHHPVQQGINSQLQHSVHHQIATHGIDRISQYFFLFHIK